MFLYHTIKKPNEYNIKVVVMKDSHTANISVQFLSEILLFHLLSGSLVGSLIK